MRLMPTFPMVKFRVELPERMGKGLFIEIDGKPSGSVNPDFMAARERADLVRRVWKARVDAITDAGEKVIAQDEADREFGREWIGGVIYDTCVAAWRTNLKDLETGIPLAHDRDTFIALADVRIVEVSKAFLDFQTACLEAGAAVLADTEATIKN